jgi:hypothetical protein
MIDLLRRYTVTVWYTASTPSGPERRTRIYVAQGGSVDQAILGALATFGEEEPQPQDVLVVTARGTSRFRRRRKGARRRLQRGRHA